MTVKNIFYRCNILSCEYAYPVVGLSALEAYVDRDTYVYLLRWLYRIIIHSGRLSENKLKLKKRIRRFERQSNLPRFLSAMPVCELLMQLEDEQYFYPIRKNEVTLPIFH